MANEDGGNTPDLATQAGIPTGQAKVAQPIRPLAGNYDEDQMDPEEYAKLLDLYDSSFRNISEGEVVKGTVLKVTASAVVIDVGYKSEGVISVSEFFDESGQVTVQPGDIVEVLLERTEDREGYVVLAQDIETAHRDGARLERACAEVRITVRTLQRWKADDSELPSAACIPAM